jgi:hypothetical protein
VMDHERLGDYGIGGLSRWAVEGLNSVAIAQ